MLNHGVRRVDDLNILLPEVQQVEDFLQTVLDLGHVLARALLTGELRLRIQSLVVLFQLAQTFLGFLGLSRK